jgi:arylformamidase
MAKTSVFSREEHTYFDISPEISTNSAVFPGDLPFRRIVALDFKKGHNLTLSSIQSTLHIGAHADSPGHYHPDGSGIDTRPLDYYFGDCQVISVSPARGARIKVADLKGKKITAPRVLLKTLSYPDPNKWSDDFNSLSPELVNHLAAQGVKLIGIDTPSVDPADDKVLESHQAVFANDLAILEGIVLNEVADGNYTLIALPLKIKDADASPVRAILWKR